MKFSHKIYCCEMWMRWKTSSICDVSMRIKQIKKMLFYSNQPHYPYNIYIFKHCIKKKYQNILRKKNHSKKKYNGFIIKCVIWCRFQTKRYSLSIAFTLHWFLIIAIEGKFFPVVKQAKLEILAKSRHIVIINEKKTLNFKTRHLLKKETYKIGKLRKIRLERKFEIKKFNWDDIENETRDIL